MFDGRHRVSFGSMRTPSRDVARSATAASPRTVVASRLAVGAGLCIGLLGAAFGLSPPGQALERVVALDWVMQVRGPRSPPAGIAVVSVDERDVARARDDRRLGRGVYAALIERLDALGASVVVLDVAFEDAGEADADRALEEALARNGRTVLFQRLTRTAVGDAPLPPLERFADAARAVAVFPLPRLPGRVDRYWPFFRVLEQVGADGVRALRELPSLPVAALQLELIERVGAERFERLFDALPELSGIGDGEAFGSPRGLDRALVALRRVLADERFPHGALARAIDERFGDGVDARRLHALFGVLSEPATLHLNLYGPARTISTLGHERVLGAPGETLRGALSGKVVFVGHSAVSAVDQRDGFRTVYTREDGLELSGVEIAATAYANLLDGSALRPLPPALGALSHLALGMLATLIGLRARIARAVLLTATLAGAQLALAVHSADAFHRLLPLAVPVLVLLPLTLFSTLLYRHLRARRQRDRYHRGALVMVPARAMAWIERAEIERAPPEHLHGSCMITDGAGYTRVAESIGETRLADLSREYFALLERRVAETGGELMDFEGDSMTAVWTGRADAGGRAAPEAAVRITRAVDGFNRRHARTPLPTRIGLHRGPLAFVNIGGGHVYRHRVVGDVVNTASRLEGLNKRLGTAVLASRAAVGAGESVLLRPVGRFLLEGKREPLEVLELRGARAGATRSELSLCARFEAALETLRERGQTAAKERFIALGEAFGADGPTRFYLDLLRGRGASNARLRDDGVVLLEGK